MKGMILAAGFGERLWPLTCDRTKPALPVLGKPLVGYVAEYLAKYGIEDVIVNLHISRNRFAARSVMAVSSALGCSTCTSR